LIALITQCPPAQAPRQAAGRPLFTWRETLMLESSAEFRRRRTRVRMDTSIRSVILHARFAVRRQNGMTERPAFFSRTEPNSETFASLTKTRRLAPSVRDVGLQQLSCKHLYARLAITRRTHARIRSSLHDVR
jgi:hypothetical protein